MKPATQNSYRFPMPCLHLQRLLSLLLPLIVASVLLRVFAAHLICAGSWFRQPFPLSAPYLSSLPLAKKYIYPDLEVQIPLSDTGLTKMQGLCCFFSARSHFFSLLIMTSQFFSDHNQFPDGNTAHTFSRLRNIANLFCLLKHSSSNFHLGKHYSSSIFRSHHETVFSFLA